MDKKLFDQIELAEKVKTLQTLSAIYNFGLTPGVIEVWMQDNFFGNISSSVFKTAADRWLKNSKNKRMPYPAELLDVAMNTHRSEHENSLVAQRVFESVRRHGNPWRDGYYREVDGKSERYWLAWTIENSEKKEFKSFEEALAYELGSDGMMAAKILGWQNLCETQDDQRHVAIAQLREIVGAVYERSRDRRASGVLNEIEIEAIKRTSLAHAEEKEKKQISEFTLPDSSQFSSLASLRAIAEAKMRAVTPRESGAARNNDAGES